MIRLSLKWFTIVLCQIYQPVTVQQYATIVLLSNKYAESFSPVSLVTILSCDGKDSRQDKCQVKSLQKQPVTCETSTVI